MTVLVTGGAGFIGSHLTRALLTREQQVVCLDNFNDYYAPARKRANIAPFLDHPAFTLVEGDIRDAVAVQEIFERYRPERVVHLAAMPGVPRSVHEPALYTQVNIVGTVHLLEAARTAGTRLFVFASSSTVYGATAQIPFREDDPAGRPLSPYGASKRGAEVMAHAFHHLYGLNVLVTRFFNAYGPAVRPDSAAFLFTRAIHRGETLQLYGNTRRDFTYIGDIVAGLLTALEWEGRFDIINLGNSHPVSMLEFIATLEWVIGRPATVERLPGRVGDVPVTYADISKAQHLLGYRPQTPLDEGLAHLYEWYCHEEEAGRV
jgi:UDP-glucuronate 4-epimerase